VIRFPFFLGNFCGHFTRQPRLFQRIGLNARLSRPDVFDQMWTSTWPVKMKALAICLYLQCVMLMARLIFSTAKYSPNSSRNLNFPYAPFSLLACDTEDTSGMMSGCVTKGFLAKDSALDVSNIPFCPNILSFRDIILP